MAAVNDPVLRPKVFFIDAPGGCGKTFLTNLLLATVRALDPAQARPLGGTAVAVASSGIAALLMDGGTTGHSRFKIPIPIDGDSRKPAGGADRRRQAELSAPPTSSSGTQNKLPFGGKTFVMSGDFRQVLPVVPKGGGQ